MKRERYIGYDLGETLSFTYNNQRNCLTNNKHHKGVDTTVLEKLTLINATVRIINALTKDFKEK